MARSRATDERPLLSSGVYRELTETERAALIEIDRQIRGGGLAALERGRRCANVAFLS
jgi:hypothetical protein